MWKTAISKKQKQNVRYRQDKYQGALDRFISEGHEQLQAKQNRFQRERSQSNLLWYYGYCHKIQHCASLSTRSKICRWKISREHGVEWLWQLSERMCRTLDKTLCYRWGCLYRTHHSELPFVHWLHVVQRRYIRFTRWLQWLCWPTYELGRNTEVGVRSTIKKEVTRFIQITTIWGDL